MVGLPCLACFDDFSGAVPVGVEELCVRAFVFFNSILGFKCKEQKTCHGIDILFLGLRLAASCPVVIELPADKRKKYRDQIAAILSSGRCTVADADSLYGRLQWAESSVFGRAQKVYLVPIGKQKYSRSSALSARLIVSLKWFHEYLSEPRVRFFTEPSSSVDYVVFSDASLEGLGACVSSPGEAI